MTQKQRRMKKNVFDARKRRLKGFVDWQRRKRD
jgi:hypothetical protein